MVIFFSANIHQRALISGWYFSKQSVKNKNKNKQQQQQKKKKKEKKRKEKQTIFQVQIRGWAFIRAWAFIRIFTVCCG